MIWVLTDSHMERVEIARSKAMANYAYLTYMRRLRDIYKVRNLTLYDNDYIRLEPLPVYVLRTLAPWAIVGLLFGAGFALL